ncbi:MAG TPA: carbohydrate ABC transporter permease [Candidatus Cryosericum sp.]|nr:carbohydrate ABC transporter permease [Candidatus Cryosericum sp.]
MKRKKRRIVIMGMNPKRFDRSQIKFFAYLIPITVIMGLPILFIVFNAFKPLDELLTYPPKFITLRPTLENFRNLIATSTNKAIPMSRYLFNSVLSTALVVFFSLAITIMAAYCMSKKQYKLKNALFAVNEAALMFVSVAVAIPRYFIVSKLGLTDSFWAHVIPLLAMPVGLYLVKQFIDDLPDSLIEAARIDGADDYTILWRIVIPNITPALATVAILAFQASWNSTEASNFFINNEALKSFSFYMSTLTANAGNTSAMVGQLSGNAVAGLGMQAAAVLIMFIPNLILFILLQSRVMNTMSHSGMK